VRVSVPPDFGPPADLREAASSKLTAIPARTPPASRTAGGELIVKVHSERSGPANSWASTLLPTSTVQEPAASVTTVSIVASSSANAIAPQK
jgi:hypothetical protein